MTEVSFYHLEPWPLERALPKLLERVLAADLRAVVRTSDRDRAIALDQALWTYEQDSFLPHGLASEDGAAEQPICLTYKDDNPNDASILVLVDGVLAADLASFDRCLDMFDGRDAAAVEAARERWRTAQDAGYDVTYWQHSPEGRWEKKA